MIAVVSDAVNAGPARPRNGIFLVKTDIKLIFSDGGMMHRQSWLVIVLALLVLFKSSGVYAVVHCQNMPLHAAADNIKSQETVVTNIIEPNHEALTQTHFGQNNCHQSPFHIPDHPSSSSGQACDHCCSVHSLALPDTIELYQQNIHDRASQPAYFHSSAYLPAEKRPPKFA